MRGSIVVHEGNILPRVAPPPAPAPTPSTLTKEEAAEVVAITPWQKVSREVITVTAGMGGVLALGKATGTAFMDNFFTFGLAALVGYRQEYFTLSTSATETYQVYRVVWQVAPALHSPLMV